MKKLIIAAAVVCAAVVSQAATCSWAMTNVKGPDGTTANAGVAYMVAYQTGSGYSASTVGAAILAAYAADGIDGVQTFINNNSTGYSWKPATAGTYSDSSKTVDPVNDMGLEASKSYNFYAVIFDTATIADAENFVVSKELTGKLVPNGASNLLLSFGTQADYTTSEKWTALAPEPTSGLMMLLGMGVLALRRRRA